MVWTKAERSVAWKDDELAYPMVESLEALMAAMKVGMKASLRAVLLG
jgi:hypothetical protein